MYNEELEMLIDAALADGVLTDNERQILFKKAQALGVDLDEFNMVLEGRLAKVKEQRNASSKSNKQGAVKRCPACGALVQQMQIKCPECGYEFRDVGACSATKELQQKLDEIEADSSGSMGVIGMYAKMAGMDKTTARKVQIIKNWPVPNTKEDLIEMLTLCNANGNINMDGANKFEAQAWNSKLKQVLSKAKVLLKDDPEGQAIIQEIEAGKAKNRKTILCVLIAAVVMVIIIAVSVTRCVQDSQKKDEAAMAELKDTIDKAESFVMDGDCEKAATVLSFCKVDVKGGETSDLYASAVSKVAGVLLENGDTTKARTLYDSAIAKLGYYGDSKLDSLAKRLGLKTDTTEKSEEKESSKTENQESGDGTDEDGEGALSGVDENGWLDKQIDKASKKLNKKLEQEIEKLNE